MAHSLVQVFSSSCIILGLPGPSVCGSPHQRCCIKAMSAGWSARHHHLGVCYKYDSGKFSSIEGKRTEDVSPTLVAFVWFSSRSMLHNIIHIGFDIIYHDQDKRRCLYTERKKRLGME